ncbi:MAG: carotenoid biosynthesis protein [Sphingobacteriales bacterium]|jgi:putative membrane protein|nr:carotenoid biosynthesis protein [Sphingobacteriales bacterium]
MSDWFSNKEKVLTIALIIFYIIGAVGISIQVDFARLTPFNLIITGFILFYLHPNKDILFFLNLFFVFVAAWFLEMIGTNTGIIFGSYKYGDSLGLKLNQTPIIIGLNWIIVAYSSIVCVDAIAKKLNFKIHEIVGAIIAAIFMVILDVLIEPVAPKLNFWAFENLQVPVQNYTAWFFFGFAFCYWMLKGGLLKPNPMATKVLAIQALFFLYLNLSL